MFSSYAPTEARMLRAWGHSHNCRSRSCRLRCGSATSEVPSNRVLVLELGPNNYMNKHIRTLADNNLLWHNPELSVPSPSDLSFRTTKQFGRQYQYPRGNGSGGSVTHHSAVDGRGSPLIYDHIAKLVGDPRWSYKNVLPYFKKMESYYNLDETARVDKKYHGTHGWLPVRPGTSKAPLYLDFALAARDVTGAPIQRDLSGNPKHSNGIALVDLQVSPNGERANSFTHLLLPLLWKQPNVLVLFNTMVTRLLFGDNESKTVIGVEARHQPRYFLADLSARDQNDSNVPFSCVFFARKEVILCGGAINSPHLLLLSGIGPREELEKHKIPVVVDLPGVGRDLLDHNEVVILHEIDPAKMVWPSQAANIIDKIQAKLRVHKQEGLESSIDTKSLSRFSKLLQPMVSRLEQKQTAGGLILDWFSGLPTDIGHDLHIHSGEGFWFDFDFSSTDPLPDGKLRIDYVRSQTDPDHPDFLRVFHNCLIENLRVTKHPGSIKLASADPSVPPILDLGLYQDDMALERLALAIQMIRQIVRHPRMISYYKRAPDTNDPLEIFPGKHLQTVPQLKEYIKRWSTFGHHISGTSQMGHSSSNGAVVDSNLRVRGVKISA